MPLHQPDLRPFDQPPYTYRLHESYIVQLRDDTVIEVPEGFLCNGASVPRLAWTLSGLRPDGLIRAAALVHDALYRYQGTLPPSWIDPYTEFDREGSDRVFRELMRRAGMSGFRAGVAYRAVRWFGQAAWESEDP